MKLQLHLFQFYCIALQEWFVPKPYADRARDGLPLNYNNIEYRPVMLPNSCGEWLLLWPYFYSLSSGIDSGKVVYNNMNFVLISWNV